MTEIIPSINALTFQEVQGRIAKVEPYVSWCHLDVTDGVFSAHATWRDPADLAHLETTLKAEVHLMVNAPERIIDQWLVKPIKRVIIHWEAMRDPELMIKKCHNAGSEVGFALKPETPWEKLKPWLGKIDMVLLLRVPPGASGQKMQSEMLGEIRGLRNSYPRGMIEIDGGVNQETARRAVEAGANILIAGSAIFDAPDIAGAIEGLQGGA